MEFSFFVQMIFCVCCAAKAGGMRSDENCIVWLDAHPDDALSPAI